MRGLPAIESFLLHLHFEAGLDQTLMQHVLIVIFVFDTKIFFI